MKLRTKISLSMVMCLLVILASFSTLTCATIKKNTKAVKTLAISQSTAMKKVLKVDKNITRLIPCSEQNTIKKVVDKYNKTYYMFLADYGTGDNEITLEYLYLVDKNTGIVYTLMVNGTPIPVSSDRKPNPPL